MWSWTAISANVSRTLSKSERNYLTHKLVLLVLKWAITDGFYECLYGGTFDVFTDNNPLTYILTSAKLYTVGQCWVTSWATCNFKLHYKTGKSHVESDALSHILWDREECETLEDCTVEAIMAGRYCKVALFKHYIAYLSTSYEVQLPSPAPGTFVVNKRLL